MNCFWNIVLKYNTNEYIFIMSMYVPHALEVDGVWPKIMGSLHLAERKPEISWDFKV